MIKHIALILIVAANTLFAFNQNAKGKTNRESHSIPTLLDDTSIYLYAANVQAKQRLDSVIAYGENESSGRWDKRVYKESFFYENHRDTVVLNSRWDDENNKWKSILKVSRRYNEINKLASYERHVISRSKSRKEYTYNDNEDLIGLTQSIWLAESEEWLRIEKTIKHYNSEGLLQADSTYKKYTDSDDWVLSIRKVYTYNDEGNLLTDTSYTKQRNSDEWVVFGAYAYEYNSGNLELVTFFRWDKYLGKFIPNTKEQTLYGSIDWNVSEIIEYKWNNTENQWEITKKRSFGFDETNHLNSITNKDFGTDTTVKKTVFSFDYTLSKDDLLLPSLYFNRAAFHHKITREEYFNTELEKYRETEFFYSAIDRLSSKGIISQETIGVYPNPAKESVNIFYPSTHHQVLFELYDINGEIIISSTVDKGETLDISALRKGFYIYSIKYGNQRSTGKIVKD